MAEERAPRPYNNMPRFIKLFEYENGLNPIEKAYYSEENSQQIMCHGMELRVLEKVLPPSMAQFHDWVNVFASEPDERLLGKRGIFICTIKQADPTQHDPHIKNFASSQDYLVEEVGPITYEGGKYRTVKPNGEEIPIPKGSFARIYAIPELSDEDVADIGSIYVEKNKIHPALDTILSYGIEYYTFLRSFMTPERDPVIQYLRANVPSIPANLSLLSRTIFTVYSLNEIDYNTLNIIIRNEDDNRVVASFIVFFDRNEDDTFSINSHNREYRYLDDKPLPDWETDIYTFLFYSNPASISEILDMLIRKAKVEPPPASGGGRRNQSRRRTNRKRKGTRRS